MGGMNYPGSVLEGQENVGAKTMESPNPFTYSDSASQIKTNVKALSFAYPNGTAIKMENTSEPFNIWLDGRLPVHFDDPSLDQMYIFCIQISITGTLLEINEKSAVQSPRWTL